MTRDALILQPDDAPFKHAPVHGTDISGSWISYSKAYRRAADSLVDVVLAKNTLGRDATEICPILFLYRHFLELELKSLVVLAYLAQQTVNLRERVAKLLSTHSLTGLVSEYRAAAITGSTLPTFLTQFERVERCITEFAAHDSSSYVFRYPIDKKLNSNAVTLNSLDLANLREVVDKMTTFFLLARKLLQV